MVLTELPRVDLNISAIFLEMYPRFKINLSLWVFGVEGTDLTQVPGVWSLLSIDAQMWSRAATLPTVMHIYVVNCSSKNYLISSSVQWETVPVVRQKVWHTPTRPKQVGTFHNPHTFWYSQQNLFSVHTLRLGSGRRTWTLSKRVRTLKMGATRERHLRIAPKWVSSYLGMLSLGKCNIYPTPTTILEN